MRQVVYEVWTSEDVTQRMDPMVKLQAAGKFEEAEQGWLSFISELEAQQDQGIIIRKPDGDDLLGWIRFQLGNNYLDRKLRKYSLAAAQFVFCCVRNPTYKVSQRNLIRLIDHMLELGLGSQVQELLRSDSGSELLQTFAAPAMSSEPLAALVPTYQKYLTEVPRIGRAGLFSYAVVAAAVVVVLVIMTALVSLIK